MSFIELIIILLITIGIADKRKIQKLYKALKKYQSGPNRQIVGDVSLEEKWIWIDRNNSEEE
tara:strand:+ start:2238 stop:2423 length:186 start_codon:yes stop_codon:yes gene_type:complete